MKKIQESYNSSLIIQKSKFITGLFRVNSIAEVNTIIAATSKKYYDATHNCYAYIIGNNAEIQKCYDDGEPAKTAGAPMLDVLKKNNVTNILAIVTRYFGGILLGAGGLTRAYSSSVSECIKQASFYEEVERKKYQLTITYAGYNVLIKAFPYLTIEQPSFLDNVILTVNCSVSDAIKFETDLYNHHIDVLVLRDLGNFTIERLIEI